MHRISGLDRSQPGCLFGSGGAGLPPESAVVHLGPLPPRQDCAPSRLWYDSGMTAAKIAITLPQEQLARVKRAVRTGAAESVSGYIAAVLAEHEQRESLDRLVQDLIQEHGEPSKKERAWARNALGRRPSRG